MRFPVPLLAIAALSMMIVSTGCTVSGDDPATELGVPRGATVVDEGSGRLEYKPNRDGHIYVHDIEDDRLVLERPINANETFVVDARNNRITLNDKRVTERGLKSNHRHRIYFKKR
jgi:hypothetical protein